MMVAIAIFMVVAVIAVAALLKIVDANKKSQTLQDAVNNINFAMDSITREIRVGSGYTCPQSVSGPFLGYVQQGSSGGCARNVMSNQADGSSIAFLSSNTASNDSGGTCNLTYAYFFEPVRGSSITWTIEKAQQSPSGDCKDSLSANSYQPIIDPSIIITTYNIKVIPSQGNPNVQPSVFMYIAGYTGTSTKTQTYFNLQTTVSERI